MKMAVRRGVFVDTWRLFRPSDEVIGRDVGRFPPPPMSEGWIAAAFTKPERRTAEQNQVLALSDVLVDELTRADVIVLGTPMYNYGMPSSLKAWVDQVIRVDKSFTFDLARGEFPIEPILTGKTLVLLSASGEFGFEAGGIREHMNHLDSHIRVIMPYLGAVEIHHVAIEYQEFGGERHSDSIKAAHMATRQLARELVANVAGELRSAC
jgi:FMN-dependent NADH-azoreductase